ncbi:LON peptidase N-terminal domain and RING finger protein 3 [Geodia barretti]|uniref:LON peptidase N-terminal domain and RING finger protein 3 n=1 Tax=Geodia barretti TaxID=519541 RepID=A0AA35RRQ4_GEOBA|nr:LON peptidase N-terminal domain and RING finger protein 3 [Geodia barretti]
MAEGGKANVNLDRQNTEDSADLPLKIPVSSVYEHFQCPICMSTLSDPSVTKCGHRFCHKCIEECINRRHECPCCKTALNRDDVIVDHSFAALMRSVRDERRKAEREYYQQLVDAATDAPFGGTTDGSRVVESPLESILRKRLSQLVEIEMKGEEKKEMLAKELEKTEQLLTSTYDRYLTEYLPSPSTIPVTVSLSVPERQFLAPEVILRPEDSMAAVLKKLRSAMEESGMAIAEFPPCEEFAVSIINPFARTNEGGVADESQVGGANSGNHDDERASGGIKGQMNILDQVLHADCKPLLEFCLKPGTELRFKGAIVLVGETPLQCFAATFVKGQTARGIDYFTCRDCGFNWVCQPCAEICHKGHSLVSYLRNHKPTWACCYCPKKKKCSIQDKPS